MTGMIVASCPRHGSMIFSRASNGILMAPPFSGGHLDPAPAAPKRIQLSRAKGWRKPEGAVVVARPSKWGNPWRVDATMETYWSTKDRRTAVLLFEDMLDLDSLDRYGYPTNAEIRAELAGRDLACWCPLDGQPCHAEVLLRIANTPP